MSERLAISASFSVLMMAIYVLFGGDTVRVPLSPEGLESPVHVSAPGISVDVGNLLPG